MPGVSTSKSGFIGFIEKIRVWGGAIVGVVTFVFFLRKFVKEVQENFVWAVAAVVSIGWLFLFWVYTSKTERQVRDEINEQPRIEKVPKFPQWRQWALAGMILLPILTVFGPIIYERFQPIKTIILIAEFQGPAQKYAVTNTIISRMARATKRFPEVTIKELGEVIQESAESEAVKDIGAKHKASIVVWGFYDEAMNGTVHIQQVRQNTSLTLRRNDLDFNVTLAEGRGISVQEALSGDMNLLALLILGVAKYDAGDYDRAIERFTEALNQTSSSRLEEERTDIKFFLGKSLYSKGKYNEAVDKLQEVLSK